MSRRTDIPWDEIFVWMVTTGEGPRRAARHFQLPEGTVLAGCVREREREPNRLADFVAGTPGGKP